MEKTAIAIVLLLGVSAGAENLVIQSFEGAGAITFNEVSNVATYRIEWASDPDGPWTSFRDLDSVRLDHIQASGHGAVTASVPMMYRVVPTAGSPPPSGFALIPSGTFIMGSPTNELRRSSFEGQHIVTLTRDFFMQKTEVTNQQMVNVLNWAQVRGQLNVTTSTVSNAVGDPQELVDLDSSQTCQISWKNSKKFVVDEGKADYPCLVVTWYGAQVYCYYLSFIEGLDPAVSLHHWGVDMGANGYRLPTEAEWEYACRAETTTAFCTGEITQEGFYPVDPNLDATGWYGANSTNPDNPINMGRGSHPVGLKQANNWGLFDMHGNMFEWCGDWRTSTNPGTVTDPTGPTSGDRRVIRGGSWDTEAHNCRSARPNSTPPQTGTRLIGFRPVRSVVP